MGALAAADGIDFAAALADRARRAGADAAQAGHLARDRFELDADTGGVNLVATNHDDTTALTVFRDGRRGSAELTGRDETAIEAAIRNALDSADAARPDPANGVAEVESVPPSRHGPERPDRDAMLGTLRQFVGEARERFPLLRIRHADYSFEDRRRSFANTAGVRRQERRALHRFWTMFGAKDGERSTSFNYTGACAREPFERLMDAGGTEPLIVDTMRSFDPRPVPEKFTGDVIVTPHCAAWVASVLAGALDGYALMGGLTPWEGREGEPLASAQFSLLNRPADSGIADGSDFDDCGVSTRNVDVIRDGVFESFLDRLLLLAQARPAAERRSSQPRHPARRARHRSPRYGRPERGIVLARFSGRQSQPQARLQRGREELLLRRERRSSVSADRDHGERQLPGPADEHPGRVERVDRLRWRRVPVPGRLGGHDLQTVSRRMRASGRTAGAATPGTFSGNSDRPCPRAEPSREARR